MSQEHKCNHPLNHDANKQPLVSVIMNCLNCEKYVKDAIDSVYTQTYPNWEIVFWDNDSEDSSADIARSYDSRLRYFKGENTIPLGAARNKALEKADGELIAFLDCDDLWVAEKLEKQVPLFAQNPMVGIVFSDTIWFAEDGSQWQVYETRKPAEGRIFGELLGNYFLNIETVVIRRACLEGISEWFDERFNVVEERDLFTRIAYSWDAGYVDQALAMWRMHPESWTWSKSGLFPKEHELMLEKFRNTFFDFDKEFKLEINKLRFQIQSEYANIDWMEGKRRKARIRFARFLKVKPRLLIPILASIFLDYNTYSKFKSFAGSIRKKIRLKKLTISF